MDWLQVFTIIGVIAGISYWQFQKLDSDIKNVANSLDGWTKHLTAMQSEQSKRMDKMHERTDKLYEMFLELVKQNKQC